MLVGFIMTGLCLTSKSQHLAPDYQVKAVFLYNATIFIKWPSHAFTEAASPLIIGVIGPDPFGLFLDQTIRDEFVNGHPIIVKRFRKTSDVEFCHLLFINIKNKTDMEHLLESVANQPVVTVADLPGFAEEGGMIQFYTESNKTRIKINLQATRKSGITVSPQLLNLAEIIN